MLGENRKPNYIFTILVLIFVVLALAVSIFGLSVKIDENQIRIQGVFSASLAIREITEVSLIDHLPSGLKLLGVRLGSISIGVFRYPEIGNASVYISNMEQSLLLIKSQNKTIVIGVGKVKNLEYYNLLMEMLGKSL
ncbi:MAG: hypothetical protein A2087_12535 [Spirochaetes bacterium GWD1_61_31]|nr:MAG: hypothetical protein A2Y37_11475 [Spirochaetes bacterium GWB1_60_80]OHD33035.1 MAG: hypothetical protein A2004_07370 [Spirochaetes bacterium GWC1_61_12]OHD38346.1 MAG: hypothetical protein A2087_12535 [Spirochaetes bacterium GWD1_61_31]OHD43387.1 MAG: hypothetical protein A2Y35_02245 [Spirochaetes bacterium GWE1_60_18]OHD58918.1 MAG: hypothetical protein A2Y32_10685 [Spirochaetes bacterium GWF1_60_12]HAX36353.1 hypothetical protein [Spirochaetaceae bacterium]